MPSRERRLLDKDKEIRKLKNNLGHYFTNCCVLGVKNEILKQQLKIATDALKTIKGKHDPRCAVYHIDEKTAYDALEQIEALEQKK